MGNIFKDVAIETADEAAPYSVGEQAAASIIKGVPGGKFIAEKIGGTGVGKEIERASDQAGLPGKIGQGAVTAAAAALLPAVAGVGGAATLAADVLGASNLVAKGAGLVADMAASGATQSILGGIYKLGDAAADLNEQTTPLTLEDVKNRIFNADTLKSTLSDFAFGSAAHGLLEGVKQIAPAVKKAASRYAESAVGKFLADKAAKLGVNLNMLVRRVLDEGLLEPGKATEMLRATGDKMAELSAQTPVTSDFVDQVVSQVTPLYQRAKATTSLDAARRNVTRIFKRLDNLGDDIDGEYVGESIKDLMQRSRAAYRGGNSQAGQFYGDMAGELRESFAQQMDNTIGTAHGQEYRNAVQDYNTFSKIAKSVESAAAKQATVKDWLVAGASEAAGAGLAAAGHPFLGGMAALAGGQKIIRKSQAALADKFAKSSLKYGDQIASTVEHVLRAGKIEYDLPASTDDYDLHEHLLTQANADPAKTYEHVRSKLDFLPGAQADQIATQTVQMVQSQAQALPKPALQTMFGPVVDPDHTTKREFMEMHQAQMDPHWAIKTANPRLIAAAEETNPATVAAIRQQLMHEVANKPDLPYHARERVGIIMGAAGTPLQDRTVGLALQGILKTAAPGQQDQGQKGSARNAAAQIKQNRATMTRAQKLMGLGSKE